MKGLIRLSTGADHSCGIAADGLGYCWGNNRFRQLGTGAANDVVDSSTAVFGGIVFEQLLAGAAYTCGITPSGTAYCWGRGFDGQLGAGDYDDCPLPNPVVGGLTFVSIGVGISHTACGVATGQIAYCWGRGDGMTGTDDHPSVVAPVRVRGQP